eukprot:9487405-Pyramimonas_sp.AAC.1
MSGWSARAARQMRWKSWNASRVDRIMTSPSSFSLPASGNRASRLFGEQPLSVPACPPTLRRATLSASW